MMEKSRGTIASSQDGEEKGNGEETARRVRDRERIGMILEAKLAVPPKTAPFFSLSPKQKPLPRPPPPTWNRGVSTGSVPTRLPTASGTTASGTTAPGTIASGTSPVGGKTVRGRMAGNKSDSQETISLNNELNDYAHAISKTTPSSAKKGRGAKVYRRQRRPTEDKYYRRFHETTNLSSKQSPNLSTPLQVIFALHDSTHQEKIRERCIKQQRPAALFFDVCWRTVDNITAELPEKRAVHELFTPTFVDELSGYPAYIFNQCIKNRIESFPEEKVRTQLEAIFFPTVVPDACPAIEPVSVGPGLPMQPKRTVGLPTPLVKFVPTPLLRREFGPLSPGRSPRVPAATFVTEPLSPLTSPREVPPDSFDEPAPDLEALKLEFEGPEDEKLILLREGQVVRAATIEKLVERLTYEGAVEPDYVSSFLLTYRSFTAPFEFLRLLIERFKVEPIDDLKQSPEYMKYFERKAKLIRLRVCNTLKQWISNHYYDFEGDSQLLAETERFINEIVCELTETKRIGANLSHVLKRKAQRDGDTVRIINPTKTPPPILKSKKYSGKYGEWMNFHPTEFARQWCMVECEVFFQIQPPEFMGLRWSKNPAAAPKIHQMIHFANLLSRWTQTEIVSCEKATGRAEMIKRLIKIARIFEDLNNFNAVFELVAALQGCCILRLKKTWELVPRKSLDSWEELKGRMAPERNYKIYMERLHTCNPPVLPFLGIYLTRLTALDENTDTVGNLINFEKRRLTAKVIREIQQYQQLRYNFLIVPAIREYLLSLKALNEAELFKRSETIEPRPSKKD